MADYISLTDLNRRVPFKTQIDLADDKNPGEQPLTDVQETELRAAITAGTTPTDARLARIITILNGVIADGEAQVNRYLSYQFSTLPLTGTAVTDTIQAHSLTFAAWYLYGRREIPNDIRDMFEDASAWGQAIIDAATAGDGSATPISGSDGTPQFRSERRRFTRTTMQEW